MWFESGSFGVEKEKRVISHTLLQAVENRRTHDVLEDKKTRRKYDITCDGLEEKEHKKRRKQYDACDELAE